MKVKSLSKCKVCQRSKLKLYLVVLPLLALLFIAPPVMAEDKMQLEISVIKGNRELPKVLYIMPWKRLPNKSVEQKLTLHSLFEDAFDPIEPESFQQHIDNYQYYVQP